MRDVDLEYRLWGDTIRAFLYYPVFVSRLWSLIRTTIGHILGCTIRAAIRGTIGGTERGIVGRGAIRKSIGGTLQAVTWAIFGGRTGGMMKSTA